MIFNIEKFMSIDVRYWEWKSAEECLKWLFENDRSAKTFRGLLLWQESFATLNGGMLTGSYSRVTEAMLQGRSYDVRWRDDYIAITYRDQVFIDHIPNRSYPDKTNCILARLPFTN